MLLEEGLSEKEKMALEAKSFPFLPWASLASLLPRYDIVIVFPAAPGKLRQEDCCVSA